MWSRLPSNKLHHCSKLLSSSPSSLLLTRKFSIKPPLSATPKVDVTSIIAHYAQKFRKHAFFLEKMVEPNSKIQTPVFPSPTTPTTPTNTTNLSTPSPNTPAPSTTWAQAFKVVEPDLERMTTDIVDLLAGKIVPTHPLLVRIASYYFELKGKRLRPAIVLLLSHAISNPTSTGNTTITKTQLQLAGIIEMIHTASLVHDDVLDDATTRRDLPSANNKFGNKLAVMAGDFLLARASINLARLGDHEVTELMAVALGELIEGEFMQITGSIDFDYYLRKTYLKTASLLANGCRSAAILGGASRDMVDAATEYGRNIGMAFQIVDDLLDFTGSSQELGKPAAVDLSLGLATAPVLYAREEFPELDAMITRKFNMAGDVDKARELVAKSQGIQKTRQLAAQYSQLAMEALKNFSPSPTQQALLALPQVLLTRSR